MTDIQKLMLSMLVHLRVGVGVIGISLPIILAGAGKVLFGVPFAGSMSAYYHATKSCAIPACPRPENAGPCAPGATPDPCAAEGSGPMRNWFVGNLFFIGAAMFLIKGFSVWEDWALNIAGVAALGVACFPMEWPCGTSGFSIHSLHYPSAVTLFICIGFTCVFCSGKTLKEMPPCPDRDKIIARYKHWYRFLAAVMILSPVAAWIFAYSTRLMAHLGFYLEASGIFAFGAYWLLKTEELKRSDVEGRAMRGELLMDTRSLR